MSSMSFIFSVLAAAVLYCSVVSAEERLGLEVIRHQPCKSANAAANGRNNWVEKIRFPNSTESPLTPDPDHPGCYKIQGSVFVKERITGDLQMYIEMRHRPDADKPPVMCHNPDEATGCGGFGSCLYCDACSSFAQDTGKVTRAKILLAGKSINCQTGLEPGLKQDVSLQFCLPTKKEFLESQGMTEQVWNQIMKDTSNGGANNVNKLSLFLTIFIFNSKVNRLMISQRKSEKFYRQVNNLGENEQLPMDKFTQLPFNQLVQKDSGFIGCHKVFGNVYLQNDSSNSPRRTN
jgi:hypothetical protein